MWSPGGALLKFSVIYWGACLVLFGMLLPGRGLNAQQAPPMTLKIPHGTMVPLYLKDDLSSKKNSENDLVRFQVVEDVKVGNVVVMPAGSAARGHVVSVGRRSFAGRSGKLEFSVDFVKAADGTDVPLRGSPKLSGGSDARVTAAATAAYGPAALLRRGWDADIRKVIRLNAYVDGDREITLSGLARQPALTAVPQATPHPPAQDDSQALPIQRIPQPVVERESPLDVPETTPIALKSTPDGADITVDGKYAGSTPSTLRLAPGDHTISIEKSGFKTWQRTMTVSAGGSVTVDARFEQNP